MADEERASYLDSRDMGQDFWSAGAYWLQAPQQQ